MKIELRLAPAPVLKPFHHSTTQGDLCLVTASLFLWHIEMIPWINVVQVIHQSESDRQNTMLFEQMAQEEVLLVNRQSLVKKKAACGQQCGSAG